MIWVCPPFSTLIGSKCDWPQFLFIGDSRLRFMMMAMTSLYNGGAKDLEKAMGCRFRWLFTAPHLDEQKVLVLVICGGQVINPAGSKWNTDVYLSRGVSGPESWWMHHRARGFLYPCQNLGYGLPKGKPKIWMLWNPNLKLSLKRVRKDVYYKWKA